MGNSTTVFSLHPRRVALKLMVVIALLCLVHVLVMLVYYDDLFNFKADYGLRYWQITIFDLDEEESFGTWFNSFILLFAAMLLLAHAVRQKNEKDLWFPWWLILGFGFLMLSIDEIVGMHEYLNSALKETSWTAVAAVGVGVTGLFFIPFLLHLPMRSRLLFLAAAILYLGGALGVERWSDRFAEQDLLDTLEYNLWTAVEEVMEMTGVVLFVYALLTHMTGSPRHSLPIMMDATPVDAQDEPTEMV